MTVKVGALFLVEFSGIDINKKKHTHGYVKPIRISLRSESKVT